MPTHDQRADALPAFPIRTIRIGLAIMIALLLASTALTWRLGNQIRSAVDAQVQVLTAAGKLEHYGNVLELSIKAVVNHGDAEAAAEYRRIQPRLRMVLTSLRSQIDEPVGEAQAALVDRSDLKLVELEYRALHWPSEVMSKPPGG